MTTISTSAEEQQFESLIEFLAQNRSFDFGGYKRPSLMRRFRSRMDSLGLEYYADYKDYLEVHPDEFGLLFDAILINVTSFFRDPPVWDYVAQEIVPRLLADRPPGAPVRVWSAGCATGEEACTIAMVLAEAMGVEHFAETVKIYGTDVDEAALAQARLAEYSAREVEAVPEHLRSRYLEPDGPAFALHKDLRRNIVYGRHNLVLDAPISRVDLLLCRNALMYFNAEAQAAVLRRLHFALRDDGVLLMGKAEMLLTHGQLFAPIDLRKRAFSKVPWRGERPIVPGGPVRDTAAPAGHPELAVDAFDATSTAQVVVGPTGNLLLANVRGRSLLGLGAPDLGRPLHELVLASPRLDLRQQLERVAAERRPLTLTDVEWRGPAGNPLVLDVGLVPLTGRHGELSGVLVSFADAGRHRQLREELHAARRELETAYEELQTTNEEFQSAIEELETTNEELQSTNEELETVNEELQSTNEELEATNQEALRRGDELDRVNAFLASVFASLRAGVVVTDLNLRVQVWNHTSEDLWGLRSGEAVGQSFVQLDIGLPIDRLLPAFHACVSGSSPQEDLTVPATNRRGRTIDCRVKVLPLIAPDDGVRGAIFLMDAAPPDD